MTAPLSFPPPIQISLSSSNTVIHSQHNPISPTFSSLQQQPPPQQQQPQQQQQQQRQQQQQQHKAQSSPTPRTNHAIDLRMFEPIPPSSLLKIYKGCANCRTQKIKCNGQEPCARCHAFGLTCQYIVLPNQAAHRLAALAAATAYSTDSTSTAKGQESKAGAETATTSHASHATIPASILTTVSSHKLSAGSATSPITTTRIRGANKKVRTVPRRKAEVAPSQPPRSPSPELSSTLETVFSPAAQQFVKTVSGIPNVILQSLIQAADPDSCIAKGSPIPDEPTPNPEVMRELIQLYLRYSHPIHRIVNDQDPDFWPRLYDRLTPEAASIVYAMCTVGALYRNRPPGAENLDEMVGYFYRRTIAVHETRSEDIISIQTMLILQNFLVITLRSEECAKFLGRMLKIANDIRLAETVQKIASQPTMSPEDVVVRNTWRLLIWTEIMGNMLSLNNGPVDPMKDLTNAYLDARPEEMPSSKLSSGEIAYYHFGCLLKIFQSITRIRLPMSAGYLYPVTTTLDALANWHNSLPKHMRVNPRTGGAAALSSHASNLDLYYRLGHIVLLNNLPQSVRSSSTGLGPRRDSPLRMLATFANGITATVGDIVMEPDLRNFSIIIGMRCLTEAATIQTANSKEPDPAISTPAKVNLMKTLWCIRQFNFAVTSKAIGGILTSFDLAAKQASVPQTAIPTDSPTLPGPSHNRREHSLASDYTSSTASTRERSYMTSYEIDDAGNPDKERPSRDSATAPTVTLESPITGQHRSNIPMPGSTSQSAGGVTDSSTKTNHRVVDGDRSRSSPVLMFSPKLESPGGAASTATSGSRSPMPPPPQATYDRSQSNTQYGQDHNQPYHSRRAPETIPQRHYLDGHGSSQTNEHVSNPRASAWPQPHRSDGTDGQDYFDSSHQQQHNQIKRPTGPQPPHLSTATLPPNSSHPYQQSSHTPLSDASDIGAHHHGFSTGYSRPSSSPSTSSHGNYSRPPRSNRVEIDPYMDSAGASTLPMTQPDTEYTSPQQSTSRPGQAQGQTQGQTQGQAPSGTDSAFHSSRPITRPEYSSSDYSHGQHYVYHQVSQPFFHHRTQGADYNNGNILNRNREERPSIAVDTSRVGLRTMSSSSSPRSPISIRTMTMASGSTSRNFGGMDPRGPALGAQEMPTTHNGRAVRMGPADYSPTAPGPAPVAGLKRPLGSMYSDNANGREEHYTVEHPSPYAPLRHGHVGINEEGARGDEVLIVEGGQERWHSGAITHNADLHQGRMEAGRPRELRGPQMHEGLVQQGQYQQSHPRPVHGRISGSGHSPVVERYPSPPSVSRSLSRTPPVPLIEKALRGQLGGQQNVHTFVVHSHAQHQQQHQHPHSNGSHSPSASHSRAAEHAPLTLLPRNHQQQHHKDDYNYGQTNQEQHHPNYSAQEPQSPSTGPLHVGGREYVSPTVPVGLGSSVQVEYYQAMQSQQLQKNQQQPYQHHHHQQQQQQHREFDRGMMAPAGSKWHGYNVSHVNEDGHIGVDRPIKGPNGAIERMKIEEGEEEVLRPSVRRKYQ